MHAIGKSEDWISSWNAGPLIQETVESPAYQSLQCRLWPNIGAVIEQPVDKAFFNTNPYLLMTTGSISCRMGSQVFEINLHG